MDQGLFMVWIEIEGPSVAGFRLSQFAIRIADDAQKMESLGRGIAAAEIVLATLRCFSEIACIGELADRREHGF